jgi:hypothetical protein
MLFINIPTFNVTDMPRCAAFGVVTDVGFQKADQMTIFSFGNKSRPLLTGHVVSHILLIFRL